MDLQKVGKFLSEQRKIKQLTQDRLGEQIGVNGKTISKWERGVNAPDISGLNRLAELLDVNVSEILNGERNNDNSDEKNDKIIDKLSYYTKMEKLKYIKLFLRIIAVILIVFVTLFTINNYNQFNMYSITSKIDKFLVEGIIISNQERNMMIIKNIDIKDEYIGTNLEEKVKSIKISITSENKNVFSLVYESEEMSKPINSLLLNRTYFLDEDINSNENIISKNVNIGKLKLQIEYINDQDMKNKIVIPLNVEKEYSNNKIFY